MKKIFLISFLGTWLVSVYLTASGQLTDNSSHGKYATYTKVDSEKSSPLLTRVRPIVVRNFLKTYQDVSDEKWFEVKDGFAVIFRLDEVGYQVTYTKRGDMIRTIRTYNEARMSQVLRHLVKSTYYDYDISLVQEIESSNNPATYIIQLLSKTELMTLRVTIDEMEVLNKFKRSE